MAHLLLYNIYMNRYVIIGWAFGFLVAVNFCSAQWLNRRPMQYARYGAMTAVVNNRIYVIGGLVNQNTAVGYVEEYNPMLDTWVLKAPMQFPRAMSVCGVINNKIYIVGGIKGRNIPVESVEVYDPILNQWQRKRRLPTRRTGYNGGAIADSIYVCGGFFSNSNTYTDMVEVYCASRDSWFTRHSMNQARVDFGASSFRNRIFAISGLFFNYINLTEEYSPLEDTWRIKAPIPFARIGIACATINNRLFLIGGERRGPRIVYSRVDVYNADNNSWMLIDSVNQARSYASAVGIGNNVYVIGGLLRNEMPTTAMEQYSVTALEENENQTVILPEFTAFPNPFRINTVFRIPFSVSVNKEAKIKIYDVSGKLVKCLSVEGLQTIIWNRTDELNRRVSEGVYFARIENASSQGSLSLKIMVLK